MYSCEGAYLGVNTKGWLSVNTKGSFARLFSSNLNVIFYLGIKSVCHAPRYQSDCHAPSNAPEGL